MFNVKEVNDGKEANLSQLNASRSGATMAQVKKSLKKSQLFENRNFLIIEIFLKSQLFENRIFFFFEVGTLWKSHFFRKLQILKIAFFLKITAYLYKLPTNCIEAHSGVSGIFHKAIFPLASPRIKYFIHLPSLKRKKNIENYLFWIREFCDFGKFCDSVYFRNSDEF